MHISYTHRIQQQEEDQLKKKMRGWSKRRWCPTPQQLMVLDQLYTRGLKTPTASQIQRIAAHLSHYGNIQGKNVFYWFQNQKARDRQKLRNSLLHLHYQRLPHHYHFQGSGIGGEEVGVPEAMSRRTMIMEVGPIHCCRRTQLQTLQLFPLSAEAEAEAEAHSYTQS